MTDNKISLCHDFIFDKLLTNWAQFGINKQGGYSEESLTKDWKINPVGKIRLLTQCRQLYTFSHAYLFTQDTKWLTLLTPLYHFILEHYTIDFATEEMLKNGTSQTRWRFSLNDDLQPLDDTTDAYALAFILLSFSFYYQATKDDSALHYIEQTDAFLQQHMQSDLGGFYEAYPINTSTLRRQNPHMHLLEGYIAAYQTSENPVYKTRIIALLDLLKTHFYHAESHSLLEFFDSSWKPDTETGHKIEPGHHFEWVWLLHQAYKIHADNSYLDIAKNLWDKACVHGFDPKGGIYNQIDAHSGSAIDKEKRIWPITEYLKAACVQVDRASSEQRIHQALDFMLQHYLLEDGSWNEYLDQDNQAKPYHLPGTTSYHIFLGLIEVLRWNNLQN